MWVRTSVDWARQRCEVGETELDGCSDVELSTLHNSTVSSGSHHIYSTRFKMFPIDYICYNIANFLIRKFEFISLYEFIVFEFTLLCDVTRQRNAGFCDNHSREYRLSQSNRASLHII